MKKQIFLSIAFVMLLIGCKKETPAPTTSGATVTIKPIEPKSECYVYDANGSIVELKIHYNPNDVTGTLNYSIAEKDRNTGTFKGKFVNDILIADYAFQSEGAESIRQVAFKFVEGKFVEGYGDLTDDGTRFKDSTKIQFDSKMPLSKVECDK